LCQVGLRVGIVCLTHQQADKSHPRRRLAPRDKRPDCSGTAENKAPSPHMPPANQVYILPARAALRIIRAADIKPE
jgi:hypothetical protein